MNKSTMPNGSEHYNHLHTGSCYNNVFRLIYSRSTNYYQWRGNMYSRFPVILKHSLQNNKKILKKYFTDGKCIMILVACSRLHIIVLPVVKWLTRSLHITNVNGVFPLVLFIWNQVDLYWLLCKNHSGKVVAVWLF